MKIPGIRRLAIVMLFTLCTAGLLLSQGTHITLLHVNDTHSHLDAVGPKDASLNGTLGGIARAATVIGQVRAAEPNVLLLHGGDAFVGDPIFNAFFGAPELMLMKQIGFDAMAVGNHEFDLGPDVLNGSLEAAFAGGAFPLLSANLNMDAYPSLKTWIAPSMLKTIGGVKVGIFGLTVPNNPTNNPAPVIVEEDVFTIAGQNAASLRGEGAQVVICLSHLGVYLDKLLAASVPGIDFIIGAHDHLLLAQPLSVTSPSGGKTLIMQAGEHYKNIGELQFTVDQGQVTVDTYSMLTVDSSVPAEPSVQAAVDEIKSGVVAKFGDLYGKAVGYAAADVAKRFDTQTPLRDTPIGNLVTDAFRERTGTQIAITALGLISEKIYRGPVTGADIFRSLSYGYDPATGYGLTLATMEITGAELVKGMEIGLSHLEVTDDFFLQYSGLRFQYDVSKPEGERVIVSSIHIGEKGFDPSATYTVTVNTGLVGLISAMGVTVHNITLLPDFEYAVVRDYIAKCGLVNYHPQGRIREQHRHGGAAAEQSAGPFAGEEGTLVVGNAPNPFNPSTTIQYEIPVEEKVSLAVYNTLGQQVSTLVDEVQSAGAKRVNFDARSLPSGLYFYSLKAGRLHAVGKMMLVR